MTVDSVPLFKVVPPTVFQDGDELIPLTVSSTREHKEAFFKIIITYFPSSSSIMASYGTVQRPTASSTATSKAEQPDESKDSTRKKRDDFKLICPFNIPLTPEAAAVRIIRNLENFGLYYTIFVWGVLFITLVPQRKVSLVYLVATTYVTCVYLLLLRAQPNSMVLHRVIDKRLVLALLAVATAVELILTHAGIHLLATLAGGVPVVIAHAVLYVADDLFVGEEACAAGELVPLVDKKTGDVESPASV